MKRKITEERLVSLKSALAAMDWSDVIKQSDPEVAYSVFFKVFNNAFDEFCPVIAKKSANRRTTVDSRYNDAKKISLY